MKKFLLCVLLTGCTHGQVHLENDYGAWFHDNDDQYFTHGSKFSFVRSPDRESRNGHTFTYSIGQNIYTPSEKRSDSDPDKLRNSRPYTGWLYGEYRKSNRNSSGRTITGFQIGCSGPCSYAREVQRGVHKLLDQGYPTWDPKYALKSEPGIILQKENYYEKLRTNHVYLDCYNLLKVGNIVDSASIGTSFMYGTDVSDFSPEPIVFKKAKKENKRIRKIRSWGATLFANAEVRYVAYNHMLEGSLFRDERHTVESRPFVGEANLGIRLEYKEVKFSYNYSVITDEWSGQDGAFFFGGLDVSW